MYKINLTCVFSLLRRTVYIGFTPFRIFRYLSQKCIPNQNQYGFCTKQEVVVFHGKIAWKPYHTKKNSRLCSIYYTINWNYIICAAIVSWKTWLPLLILNNFFLFLISKFWRPQTTQCVANTGTNLIGQHTKCLAGCVHFEHNCRLFIFRRSHCIISTYKTLLCMLACIAIIVFIIKMEQVNFETSMTNVSLGGKKEYAMQ